MSTVAGCRGNNTAEHDSTGRLTPRVVASAAETGLWTEAEGRQRRCICSQGPDLLTQGACQGTWSRKQHLVSTAGTRSSCQVLSQQGSAGQESWDAGCHVAHLQYGAIKSSSWVPASRTLRGRFRKPRDLLQQPQQVLRPGCGCLPLAQCCDLPGALFIDSCNSAPGVVEHTGIKGGQAGIPARALALFAGSSQLLPASPAPSGTKTCLSGLSEH